MEANGVKVKSNLGDGVNNQLEIETPNNITIKGILGLLMENTETEENGVCNLKMKKKKVISLGMGDPTAYSCFHSPAVAQDAVLQTLASHKFNGYSPTVGLPQTRKAIADYLSRDLPDKLCADDVYVTAGCTQAIEIALSILARPGSNILLPRPGFPIYALCAAFRHIEVRYFDLVPGKGWEVDLNSVEALADRNTIAIVVINPGNPCGNVYSYQHLQEVVLTAIFHTTFHYVFLITMPGHLDQFHGIPATCISTDGKKIPTVFCLHLDLN